MRRLIESRDAGEKARLEGLREAARVRAADIDAGRFRSLGPPAARKRGRWNVFVFTFT